MNACTAAPIPLIHITDLYHPHEDPDDHFDLAFLYCDPDIDLKAVVLDRATHAGTPAGDGLPVRQLNHLFGRDVPYATGASSGLQTLTDSRASDPSQGGIDLILDVLTNATERVVITSVGSCRDLAAAYNRNPALFDTKAGPVYIFAGDGATTPWNEWNVGLDVKSYVRLMQANSLDIRWVPCFDGGTFVDNPPHRNSYWINTADLYVYASDGLKQYNGYMGANLDPATVDPIAYLSQPVGGWGSTRNLWGAAVLTAVSGRPIVLRASRGDYFSIGPAEAVPSGCSRTDMFRWDSVEVNIGADGITHYGHSATSKSVKQFSKTVPANYAKAMSDVTADMYRYSLSVSTAIRGMDRRSSVSTTTRASPLVVLQQRGVGRPGMKSMDGRTAAQAKAAGVYVSDGQLIGR